MDDPTSGRSFFATALIVVGVLWMTLTGLCTAGFVVSMFGAGAPGGAETLNVLAFVLFVGAVCFAPGFLIWLGGKALRRRKSAAGDR